MSFVLEVIATGMVVPADDLDALSHDSFEASFQQVLTAERTLAAQRLAMLESARRRGSHVRHGFRDTAAWVASLAGERVGAARRDVVLAEQVAATPVVAAALEAGAVSKTQAGLLVGAADLPAEVQERLVSRADRLSVPPRGPAEPRGPQDRRRRDRGGQPRRARVRDRRDRGPRGGGADGPAHRRPDRGTARRGAGGDRPALPRAERVAGDQADGAGPHPGD